MPYIYTPVILFIDGLTTKYCTTKAFYNMKDTIEGIIDAIYKIHFRIYNNYEGRYEMFQNKTVKDLQNFLTEKYNNRIVKETFQFILNETYVDLKKITFDFSSSPKPISENINFWTTKCINLNKNTEGKRWRYNPETGLCFEDNDDFVLAATYIDGTVTWLDEIPEEVKEWARKSDCEIPDDYEISLSESDFSDEE